MLAKVIKTCGVGEAYSDISIDMHCVWRERGVFGGVNKVLIDIGVGLIKVVGTFDGMPQGAIDHRGV